MTPAKMYEQFGSSKRLYGFKKGDIIRTPVGIAAFEYEFSRGLWWHVKTTKGTFKSVELNKLNQAPQNAPPPL